MILVDDVHHVRGLNDIDVENLVRGVRGFDLHFRGLCPGSVARGHFDRAVAVVNQSDRLSSLREGQAKRVLVYADDVVGIRGV